MFGFTDPAWKGRIGWAPTNASFQTMVTAMRAEWGEDRARQWLEGIRANDARVYPKNTPPRWPPPPPVKLTSGSSTTTTCSGSWRKRARISRPVTITPGRGGPGSIVMVAGAGILASAENAENAERFLQFMLSPVAQQYFAGQTFEYPLVEGVKTQRVLIPLSDIVKPELTAGDLVDLAGTQALLQDTGVLP